jgi:hypothetical protein
LGITKGVGGQQKTTEKPRQQRSSQQFCVIPGFPGWGEEAADTIPRKVDGTGDHPVEPDKPSSESQISHALANMWNLD